MSEVQCHFHERSQSAGSKCEGRASGFIKMVHSGRLCPLCGPCRDHFVSAQASISEESKKVLPGGGAYEEVSLDVGAPIYAIQPPKTK
jgi:hypothetical protein